MVHLTLTRPGLRSRVEPILQTQEQGVAQDVSRHVQQVFGAMFPRGVIIGGPATVTQGTIIEMQITEDEYAQMGRPGINETVRLEVKRIEEETDQTIEGNISFYSGSN